MPRRYLLVPAACLALGSLVGGALAAPPRTMIARASLGGVRAELSWRQAGEAATGLHLQIVRRGRTLLSGALPLAAGTRPAAPPLALRDLDHDGEPEVLVDFYTGGAHCCYFTDLYAFRTTGYSRLRHDWGNPGYRLQDLDHDARPEFVTGDDRFAYRFGSYAASVAPIRIFRYRGGALVESTRRYLAAIELDAERIWRDYLRLRSEEHGDFRGLLAAYAAELYLLGEGDGGWARVLNAWRRGDLSHPRGDPLPIGRSYLVRLRSYLAETGYVGGALPRLPPPDWASAAIDLRMTIFRPAETFGLRLQRVVARPASCGQEGGDQLDAVFLRDSAGHRLRIAEGSPFYCADIGDLPLAGTPTVHGVDARLYRYCEGSGCPAAEAFLLQWSERKTQITLIARGFTRADLLVVARSMAPVKG